MKILLVTFSDNADHQDALFGLYEQLDGAYLLAVKTPKVPLERSERTWLVDCPRRPGVCAKTFDLILLSSLIRRIRREKFDAVYFESLHVWNLPIMAAVKNRARVYHAIHDVIPHEGDSQARGVDLMNRLICKLADVVVLRNRTDDITARYGIDPGRVKVLELTRRYPAFTEPVHSGRALFFGRINPYKGAENLLEIVRRRPDVEFDIIGRADPQMARVVEALSKEKNAHVKNGYVSDGEMRKAFVGCDWVVLPYKSASQSGVIIDAYKYSRPVIAFNVGAISEQVEDGKSGYLIPAGDNRAFAETLGNAAKIGAEAHRTLCARAYEFGRGKYDAMGGVQHFMKLLEDTVDK